MKNNELVAIGQFTSECGSIIVSDPQNEKTDWWVTAIIRNVRTGLWKAQASFYTRYGPGGEEIKSVSKLVAVHDSVDAQAEAGLALVKVKLPIGIDSFRAGFFDLAGYRNDPAEFESRCREIHYKEVAGVLPSGAVADSEDGTHTLYTACDTEGKVVKLVLDLQEFYDDEEGDDPDGE